MNQSSDKEKIEKSRSLYGKFHLKMLALMKRQTKLLERVNKLIDAKKLKEIRDKIKKF